MGTIENKYPIVCKWLSGFVRQLFIMFTQILGSQYSDAGTGGARGGQFGSSVNPIPTGGGQIIPTYYYWPPPPQIFSPSGITDRA